LAKENDRHNKNTPRKSNKLEFDKKKRIFSCQTRFVPEASEDRENANFEN
jgi:hypothetical protein